MVLYLFVFSHHLVCPQLQVVEFTHRGRRALPLVVAHVHVYTVGADTLKKKVFNHICYCLISYLNSCRKHLVWFVTCYIEMSVKYTTSCFPCSWCEKPSINLSTKCSNCLKGEAGYKSSWTIWLFLSLCASLGITFSASKEEIGNTSENWFHKLFSTHSHICGDCMVMMMNK